jgi:hypothetical protein
MVSQNMPFDLAQPFLVCVTVCVVVPLQGTFVDLNNSRATSFRVIPGAKYIHPEGHSSCLTTLGGKQLYVQLGGMRFIEKFDQVVMAPGIYAMDAFLSGEARNLHVVTGSEAVPLRVNAAVACDGERRVHLFGGLRFAQQSKGDDYHPSETRWAPTNTLHVIELGGDVSRPRVTKLLGMTAHDGSIQPGPRSGHALAYLDHAAAANLGMTAGGLLLYGGSTLPNTWIDSIDVMDNITKLHLGSVAWDTAMWLFNLASGKWSKLRTEGPSPPGLMFHGIDVKGSQVGMVGGLVAWCLVDQ